MKIFAILFLVVMPVIGALYFGAQITTGGAFVGVLAVIAVFVWLRHLYLVMTCTSDMTDGERLEEQYSQEFNARHAEVLDAWERWNKFGWVGRDEYFRKKAEFESWNKQARETLVREQMKIKNQIVRHT